jgi:hypothetical protein
MGLLSVLYTNIIKEKNKLFKTNIKLNLNNKTLSLLFKFIFIK